VQNQVHTYANNGNLIELFDSMCDALRYINSNRLGADWATPTLPENPTEEDRHLLAAHLCHRALRPQWRHLQFDRLMTGEIRALPDQDWHGLEAVSVLALREMFEDAGIKGWSAMTGSVDGLKLTEDHAWMEHEDGRILDAFPPCGGADPVLYFEPQTSTDHGYCAREKLNASDLAHPLRCPEGEALSSAFLVVPASQEDQNIMDFNSF
jgi:hypothetical protein